MRWAGCGNARNRRSRGGLAVMPIGIYLNNMFVAWVERPEREILTMTSPVFMV